MEHPVVMKISGNGAAVVGLLFRVYFISTISRNKKLSTIVSVYCFALMF